MKEYQYNFGGSSITVFHDEPTYSYLDHVMGISMEEHGETWGRLGEAIVNAIVDSEGPINFMDVGTGSGVFTALVIRELCKQRDENKWGDKNFHILAIDKVPRCIEASKSTILNLLESNQCEITTETKDPGEFIFSVNNNLNIQITLRCVSYSLTTCQPESVNVIFMNPPYHIYPPIMEEWIPYHARGGSYGFELFQEWLQIASVHLKKEGLIFFHHMCLGVNKKTRIEQFVEQMNINSDFELKLEYEYEQIGTQEFMMQVYNGYHLDFVHTVCTTFPKIYFTFGKLQKMIKKN